MLGNGTLQSSAKQNKLKVSGILQAKASFLSWFLELCVVKMESPSLFHLFSAAFTNIAVHFFLPQNLFAASVPENFLLGKEDVILEHTSRATHTNLAFLY